MFIVEVKRRYNLNLSQTLTATNQELCKLGYTVEDIASGISVRLPLFCSVRIYYDGKILRFEPRFGMISRSNATWLFFVLLSLNLFVVTCLTAYPFFSDSLRFFSDGLRFFIGVTIVWSVVWDVYRYILTENLITRAQYLVFEIQKRADMAS